MTLLPLPANKTQSLAALQSPRYTLRNAARVLGISRSTLQRSLSAAHIVAHTDPMDRRCRWITKAQLLRVAHLRGAVLLDAGSALERLAALEIRVADLEQRQKECLVND